MARQLTPLHALIVLISVACFGGAALVLFMSMGEVSLTAFVLSGLIGVVAGVPVGMVVAGRMRRAPPTIRPEAAADDPNAAERAAAPDKSQPYPAAPDQGQKP